MEIDRTRDPVIRRILATGRIACAFGTDRELIVKGVVEVLL
jgi:hypothetical protein